jgi:hypothetical protein
MTTTVTNIFTRPDTTVAFYEWSSTYTAYFHPTYNDTGKRTGGSVTVSADGLTQTRINIYTDAGFAECITDSTVIAALDDRKTYNNTNGIAQTQTTVVT